MPTYFSKPSTELTQTEIDILQRSNLTHTDVNLIIGVDVGEVCFKTKNNNAKIARTILLEREWPPK